MVVVVEVGYRSTGSPDRRFDIDPSGERFLLVNAGSGPGSDGRALSSLTFVLDWFEELTERVPTP